MKRYKSMFTLIRDTLSNRGIDKQKERVDLAVKAEAEAEGDALVARKMRDHFAWTAAHINHSQRWWEYAAARQKAQDYGYEYDDLVEKLGAATARRQAEQERLVLLRDGPVKIVRGDTP